MNGHDNMHLRLPVSKEAPPHAVSLSYSSGAGCGTPPSFGTWPRRTKDVWEDVLLFFVVVVMGSSGGVTPFSEAGEDGGEDGAEDTEEDGEVVICLRWHPKGAALVSSFMQ